MIRTVTATLRSTSPYSPSRFTENDLPLNKGEKKDDYEERCWRHKAYAHKDGSIYIPPMAFKIGLDAAAKMSGRQVPGKGKATYTKYFLSGVLVLEGPTLPIKRDELPDTQCDRIHCNSNGIRGSGSRVWRLFPRIDDWEADVQFTILSDEIEQDVFEETLEQAGQFIGVGRFRPQNGGFYGRYSVDKCVWR